MTCPNRRCTPGWAFGGASRVMLCDQTGWDIAGAGSEMFGGPGYTTGHLTSDMR